MMSWLKHHYGSKRGLLISWLHRIKAMTGAYRDCETDWQAYDRIVFVCKGNICRSAFAEAVCRASGKASISCGIDTVNGNPADENALRIADSLGVDLAAHVTSRIQDTELRDGDLLVAMEPSQLDFIRHAGIAQPATLLGLTGSPCLPHIVDPYGGCDEYFSNCFDYIRNTVDASASKS